MPALCKVTTLISDNLYNFVLLKRPRVGPRHAHIKFAKRDAELENGAASAKTSHHIIGLKLRSLWQALVGSMQAVTLSGAHVRH